MPKRVSAEDASSSWVDAHYDRWERDRGHPKARSVAETSTHTTKQTWAEMEERAKQLAKEKLEAKRASEGAASSSGAARPAFEQEGLTAEEAKMYWRELTNMAFSVPGHFEPQQYVSFVAGRPVVVTRGNNSNTPHLSTNFCVCLLEMKM